MLELLLKLAPTVNWLAEVEPVQVSKIPNEHATAFKQLEQLGFAYRRNMSTCGLQKQRLRKILEKEINLSDKEQQEQSLTIFADLIHADRN